MLAEVGLGICMANGHPRAKAAARKVSNWTNDQSGVAKELELLLFSQQ
jgi:hydroxymethylpyrimidine pyrophosphatase-like HAD family hydrolase